MQLDRISSFTDEEREFLSEVAKDHGVSVEILIAQPFPTTFGEESSLFYHLIDGGENISDNFGKTSKFNVCSDNPPEYKSKKVIKNIKVKILYCFSGTIKKENKNLIEEGKLSMKVSYSYSTDKEIGVSFHDKEIELNYKAEKN